MGSICTLPSPIRWAQNRRISSLGSWLREDGNGDGNFGLCTPNVDCERSVSLGLFVECVSCSRIMLKSKTHKYLLILNLISVILISFCYFFPLLFLIIGISHVSSFIPFPHTPKLFRLQFYNSSRDPSLHSDQLATFWLCLLSWPHKFPSLFSPQEVTHCLIGTPLQMRTAILRPTSELHFTS